MNKVGKKVLLKAIILHFVVILVLFNTSWSFLSTIFNNLGAISFFGINLSAFLLVLCVIISYGFNDLILKIVK